MSRSRLATPWLTLLFLCLAADPIAAQWVKRPLTVEEVWRVQRVGKPALSPDGKSVAVAVTTYDMEKNDSTSALWLLATAGGAMKPIKSPKSQHSDPCWSPDGQRLAFVATDKGKVGQIHLVPAAGGEPRPLTDMPMSPSALKWSRDGKTIYCVAQTWPDTPDDASYRKKDKALKESKVKAHVIDDALYRYWDTWLADGKRPMVFAVDVATGKHRNLFAGLNIHLPVTDKGSTAYDVAPDGKELCFVADSVKEIGTDFNHDLYVLPLDKAGPPRNVTADNPAQDSQPVYSPEGRSLAFLRQTIKFFYADRNRLMIHDRATGKNRVVTGNFDRSCNTPRWAPDGKRLYFEAEDRGYHCLYTVTAQGGSRRALTAGFSDTAFDLSRDGETLALLRSSFDFPAQVYAMHATGGKPWRIETFNKSLVDEWYLGEVKAVYFKGADDRDVQMWIVYPPGFDASKKWPLLQVVHGGPHNAITTDFHYRWNLHLLAAKGYVVSCINFHGSSGFGQAFTDSITGDMATRPTIDVMKGTDYMLREPYIDSKRIAAMGASYGGYMMAWLNGQTDRFQAMVCHAGVYNWHGMMASDIVRGRERRLGAFPWEDHAKVDKQSPHRYSANFKTPTLVLHGEKDYRVPVTQGLEYYNTLRLKGVPARLVYFPDENHWILKPQNARLWHREVFAWLEKYIGRGPT
ncbi:MAG TPA: S9 family peptidase [Gemmataceae bacterium]|nr:S9 family peptidase [Gemmataceae bacterium]